MKIVRWTLLSLLFFLLLGLVSQARHGPQVGVLIDRHGFTPDQVDRLAYLFKARAHRRNFEIEFHYSSRHRQRFGRFHDRFYNGSNRYNRYDRYDRGHWDYTVRLEGRNGYYDRCGRYREHYDWYVVDSYERVIKRGHAHSAHRVAKDVVKVIDRHWR